MRLWQWRDLAFPVCHSELWHPPSGGDPQTVARDARSPTLGYLQVDVTTDQEGQRQTIKSKVGQSRRCRGTGQEPREALGKENPLGKVVLWCLSGGLGRTNVTEAKVDR